MKNLLYIGNKLSNHGFSETTIETLGPLLESEGFVVKYSSARKNKISRMLEMLSATFKLRNKTDYLLLDTYSTTNFWYAFFVSQLARIFEIKYIPILHGGNLPNRLKKSPVVSRMIFKNAYKNVAPSKYLFEIFTNEGFSNTFYIPNSIEIKNYPFKKRDSVEPKLLWVRAFAKIYNPNMGIEVFKIIKNEFPNASLCMIGSDKDGSLQEAKALAQKYFLDINFTGQLPKKDWVSLSSEFSVFLNTTHFDNMPVSVVEAMALGIPVISTNVGGIPYLLENNSDALLVEDNSVSQMVASIRKLCLEPDLVERLSYTGRQKSLEFDWNSVKNLWKETLI